MRVLVLILASLVAISYQKSLQNPVVVNQRGSKQLERTGDDGGRFLLGWKFLLGANYVTYTLTSWASITSTLTSLSITRCVPATLFLNVAAQASSCRRRRAIIEDIEFDEDADADSITPSIVEQWEHFNLNVRLNETMLTVKHFDLNRMKVSELPPSMSEVRRLETPEILSSSGDTIEAPRHQTGRNLYQYVVTVTSTSISYSITTTTWKTTAVMASTSTILCLPYGYSVC